MIPYAYCYTGSKPCGCVVAAHVDPGVKDKTLGEWLKRWAADGLTIERVKTEDVKLTADWDCPHQTVPSVTPAAPQTRQLRLFEVDS